MKALIVMYEGEFPSDAVKVEVIRSIAEKIVQNSSCEPENITITSFDEKEVLKALLVYAHIKLDEQDASDSSDKNDTKDLFTSNFLKACKKVLYFTHIENPDIVVDVLALRRGLTYALINAQFDECELTGLKSIMDMNFNLKQNAKFKEILRDFHLEKLPEELKNINKLIDIV